MQGSHLDKLHTDMDLIYVLGLRQGSGISKAAGSYASPLKYESYVVMTPKYNRGVSRVDNFFLKLD